MRDHDGNRQDGRGGLNHGMGMMLLCCMVPLAAIVFLPRVGVSATGALFVGIVGMIALHGGMMTLQKLKGRKAGTTAEQAGGSHLH